MQSLPQIQLVDIHGHDVASWEKATDPEPDPQDPANWPEWTDNFYWSTDPADVADLEAIEAERLADLSDAPHTGYGEQVWAQLIIEGSLPAISGGSPELSSDDISDFDAWLDQVDADYPPRDQISPDELAMLAAGLPVG